MSVNDYFDTDDYEYQQSLAFGFPDLVEESYEDPSRRFQNVFIECEGGVRFVWSLEEGEQQPESSLSRYYRSIYEKYGVKRIWFTYTEYAEEDLQKVEGAVKNGRWRPPGWADQPCTNPGGNRGV